MYKSIEDFINIVNRCVHRKESKISISIENAVSIQSELTKLLLELKNNRNEKNVEIDGGNF